jgi:hypothetical protein
MVLLLAASGSPSAPFHPAAYAAGSPGTTLHPAAYAAGSPVVLAESWSIGKFVAGGGRPRIVQICVGVMCVALFIMMRKLF